MTSATNYILRREGTGDGLIDVDLFSSTGLKVVTRDMIEPTEGFVFRWGCTATIPGDPTVVNSAKAIHRVFDKRAFRMEMSNAGLSPASWANVSDWIVEDPRYLPVLIRKNNHSRSEGMYVCRTAKEALDTCEDLGKGNYYISELIQKTNEYRVMIVQGRVIGIIEKQPRNKNEVSWGCVDTGEYKYVEWTEWPLEVARKALEAFSLSGLTFGAVDVICGPTGLSGPNRPYVLEINSAPWLSPYFCKIFVQAFDYIVKNGKNDIPVVHGNSFHGYIHPSRHAGATIA